MFPDDSSCIQFVTDSRWPDGKRCPKCNGGDFYADSESRAGRLQCSSCKYLFSATAGTVMGNTKLPISTWLQAAYLMVTDKRGISAKQLQRDLKIGRYETAWTMLQKLRAAMVNPDRTTLSGRVEVDETFIGGPVPGKHGRGTAGPEGKAIVLGAVEVRERTSPKTGEVSTYPGRIRLRLVDDFGAATCLGFIKDVVEPGAVVVTDDSRSYDGLPKAGYNREILSTAKGQTQDEVLPHFHLAVSNLKTWLKGTFHGAVEQKHLQGYLNEFTFRFNRRHNLFAAFQTMLGIAGKVKGPTREALYASMPGAVPPRQTPHGAAR
jgi:transposase-like protein